MSEYSVRVNRALNYAQEKLPVSVELDEVAQIAAFSPYHFHRVFLLVVGENFACFMRKRRLEWAAMELLNTKRRILDISLDAGYETQESFARAFKYHFYTTPGKFRSKVRSPKDAFLGLKSAFEIQIGELMKPEIVERGSFVVIGVKNDYDSPDFSGALSQWQEFWSRSHEIKTTNTNCYYGLSAVPTKTRQKNGCSGIFQYLTAREAVDSETVPEGMTKLTIPPQKYAKYTFTGPVSGFQAFIMNVWTHYLPESGLEVIESPEIEVYDERFRLDSHESEMDYLVPVK
ncbi:AraC family transcriptional regulator [Spartinivicinus poritis]|uniref:GyrI-like domain-containing protein n=1 Tax=Spartinivicinus poritis TaxID=2994640 RepID=A0ABT5UA17_9GAMM|nr:GyrI-like domain-containing protein [Spartinivicinus sp. A2-2]MDE1463005.1 GyrI-like domain-containing protein [Spartinivicinus sp. A2-2]